MGLKRRRIAKENVRKEGGSNVPDRDEALQILAKPAYARHGINIFMERAENDPSVSKADLVRAMEDLMANHNKAVSSLFSARAEACRSSLADSRAYLACVTMIDPTGMNVTPANVDPDEDEE